LRNYGLHSNIVLRLRNIAPALPLKKTGATLMLPQFLPGAHACLTFKNKKEQNFAPKELCTGTSTDFLIDKLRP